MEEFTADVCRTAAAQICEAVGFEAITASSLDTLTEILIKYLDEVGYQSHALAELSGRTHDNALDVLTALEEMGTSAWELRRFMERNELRYARPEPERLPKEVDQRPRARFGQDETQKLPPHIPDFLPEFPAAHTYKASVKERQERGGARQLKKQKNKQRHQLETSLLKLSDAGKKRPADAAFGEVPREGAAGAAADVVGPADVALEVGGARAKAPALAQAAAVNDLLANPALGEAGAAGAADAGRAEERVAAVRPFALSLLGKSEEVEETEGRADAGGGSDKRQAKARQILDTKHDRDGMREDGAGRSPGRSPADMED